MSAVIFRSPDFTLPPNLPFGVAYGAGANGMDLVGCSLDPGG